MPPSSVLHDISDCGLKLGLCGLQGHSEQCKDPDWMRHLEPWLRPSHLFGCRMHDLSMSSRTQQMQHTPKLPKNMARVRI